MRWKERRGCKTMVDERRWRKRRERSEWRMREGEGKESKEGKDVVGG